ncbi:MAG: carbon monoxide dehydrogenase [Rhodospirillales bacterium]|nr:carbon monoxide dehydrogenase [Rhodospirillales bacterium]
MDMKGEFRIPLPQALVWRALNDPEILKASIPGCDELIRESDTSFKGKISAAVGPVRAKFAGHATLSDIDAPNGYRLTGSGSGGAAGMVKGGAIVRLVSDGDATMLHYEAHAQVAGKLAQIGSRLVDMAAKKMTDEFFGNFVRRLEHAAPESPDAVTEIPVSGPALDPVIVEERPLPAEMGPETISPQRKAWLVWALVALAVITLAARWKGLF